MYRVRNSYHPYPRKFWKVLFRLPTTIKWFCQRAWRGYSEYDVWNTGFYLAEVSANMIRDLRKELHGCPAELEVQEWDDILTKIEESFRLIHEEDDSICVDFDEIEERIQEGLQLYVKYIRHLWD